MTWVKICGITNIEDALTAVEAGADALGFVFYEKSPRKVDAETARKIVEALPAEVEKVGVFVCESAQRMESMAERVGLTATQLHVEGPSLGDEKPHGTRSSETLKHYVALPVRHFLDEQGRFDGFIVSVNQDKPDKRLSGIFLDSGTPEKIGGTGRIFDWTAALPVAEVIKRAGHSLVVAGGLTPTNVTEAIRILKPWGVDVSSGVEAAPGKKDPEKVRAFVAAVRQTERLP
jgi:phosphoribosylanthranilate isomerase